MAWSNILCKVIRNSGPIVGEALLMGWQTDIPVNGFSWSLALEEQALKADRDMGEELEMAAGSTALAPVDQKAKAGSFTLKKRFDVSSAELHSLVDQPDDDDEDVQVVVTVLHTAHGRGMVVNLPGFVITLDKCSFKNVSTELSRSDKGVDVMETYIIDFRSITMLYMKALPPAALQITVPTLEFSYTKPLDT